MSTEKKNKVTSGYIAIGLHAVLLLLFFFMVAWEEPDPPIPEYGIEMNLGANFISNSQVDDDPIKAEKIDEVEEVKDEIVEEETQTEESAEETPEVESSEETVDEPVEEVVEEVTETQDIHSPDVVEKKEEVKKETPKVEPKKTESKESVKKEESKPKSNPERKLEDRAIMKEKSGGAGTGNKGASLDLSGWTWEEEPRPDDRSTENGVIVFQITIDDEGVIIKTKTIKSTVSPAVVQVYEESVRELLFRRVGNNRAGGTSTGTITFVIQSK